MTTDDQFLADLQRKADHVHNESGDSDRPPANTWAGILAQATTSRIKQEEEDEKTILSMPLSVVSAPVSSETHRPVSRFLNIAASLLVIAALAFGGWLAAIQLNDPATPTPDPRFAAMATPNEAQSQTCDVEPLSVDRVMEIVENPAYFTAHGPTEPRTEHAMVGIFPDATLWEGDDSLELLEGSVVPTQEQFDSATEIGNEYVSCIVFGTQGQVWSFYSPVHLQSSILGDFPVFSSQDEVRTRVEQRINEPAYTGELAWEELPYIDDIGTITLNPDRDLALLQQSNSAYFEQVITVGVSIESKDGEQIALTVGTGRDLKPNSAMHTGNEGTWMYVTIAKLRANDTWLIVPWPSRAQIGW